MNNTIYVRYIFHEEPNEDTGSTIWEMSDDMFNEKCIYHMEDPDFYGEWLKFEPDEEKADWSKYDIEVLTVQEIQDILFLEKL